jgi:Ca2+-binding EF-hand superfamily protein
MRQDIYNLLAEEFKIMDRN